MHAVNEINHLCIIPNAASLGGPHTGTLRVHAILCMTTQASDHAAAIVPYGRSRCTSTHLACTNHLTSPHLQVWPHERPFKNCMPRQEQRRPPVAVADLAGEAQLQHPAP